MIDEVIVHDFSILLGKTVSEAYEKLKALIKRIISVIKGHEELNIEKEFEKSYTKFTKMLIEKNHHDEANFFMAICVMYQHLFDRPEELINHEDFFNDLFIAFDELLFTKLNKPDDYKAKYREFISYWGAMIAYFGANVAIPSEYYDEETLAQIVTCLHRGV